MKLLQWVGSIGRTREVDVELVGRNVLVNGAPDIWQRGPGPFAAGNEFTADRWLVLTRQSTASVTRQDLPPGAIPGLDSPFFIRTVVTSNGNSTSYVILSQPVEGVRTLAGRAATISFWAKASVAKTIGGALIQQFGTSGSPSTPVQIPAGVIALTTAWQRFTGTVTLPDVAGKALGTTAPPDDALFVNLWLDAGSNPNGQGIGLGSATVDIAGVQLEAGKNATSFERRNIGAELALCQRYLQVITADATNSAPFALGIAYATSAVFVMYRFPVSMRRLPTIFANFSQVTNFTSLWTVTSLATSAVNQVAGEVSGIEVGVSPTTLVVGSVYALRAGAAGQVFGWTAELPGPTAL